MFCRGCRSHPLGVLLGVRSYPLGVLLGLSLPVFLARQANKTPYGRSCFRIVVFRPSPAEVGSERRERCGLPPGVASAARLFEAAVCGEKRVSLGLRSLAEWVATRRVAGLVAQARSASGGGRKAELSPPSGPQTFSPERPGWRLGRDNPSKPPNGYPLPGGNATENRTNGDCCSASKHRREQSPSSVHGCR